MTVMRNVGWKCRHYRVARTLQADEVEGVGGDVELLMKTIQTKFGLS